jgi:hypothetical protein
MSLLACKLVCVFACVQLCVCMCEQAWAFMKLCASARLVSPITPAMVKHVYEC